MNGGSIFELGTLAQATIIAILQQFLDSCSFVTLPVCILLLIEAGFC